MAAAGKPQAFGVIGRCTVGKDEITAKEIEECLNRSGYLMESRLVRALDDQGYFVEPNRSTRDPRTGKSREIDLVAEYHDWNSAHEGVAVRTTFVIEAVNNRYPFVLLTERPSSPNADFESYIKFIYTPEPNPFIEHLDLYEEKTANWKNLFSQYCVLTRKTNAQELMASHPDDVYGSLLKLAEYVEDEIARWSSEETNPYWRLFFWQPMLVVGGQLVTIKVREDGAVRVNDTEFGRLEFNWHASDEPRTTVIEVVGEQFFLNRLAVVRAKDRELETKLHELRLEK